MKKAERKRRAAEAKRKAKLAKRERSRDRKGAADPTPGVNADSAPANNAPANNETSPAGNGRESTPVTGMNDLRASVAVPGTGTADAGGTPATRADRMSAPQHSLEDEVHMSYSKLNSAEAEMVQADIAEMLGDDEAIAMLTRAARSLDNVIQYVESVLKRLPAQQVAEAIAITNEPRREGEKSRNGSNPAVQLLNIRLRAKNLLLRVMKILKPDLAKQLATA